MRVCKQKILSLTLAAAMLCTCIPTAVSADNAVDLSPATSSVDTLSLPSYYEYQRRPPPLRLPPRLC